MDSKGGCPPGRLSVWRRRDHPHDYAGDAQDHRLAAGPGDEPERELVGEVHELRHACHRHEKACFRPTRQPREGTRRREKSAGEQNRNRVRRHRVEVAQPFDGPVRLEGQRHEQQRAAAKDADFRGVGGDGRGDPTFDFYDRQKAERREEERGGDQRSPLPQARGEDESGAEEQRESRRRRDENSPGEEGARRADEERGRFAEWHEREWREQKQAGKWIEERLGDDARASHDGKSAGIRIASGEPVAGVEMELGEVSTVGVGKASPHGNRNGGADGNGYEEWSLHAVGDSLTKKCRVTC